MAIEVEPGGHATPMIPTPALDHITKVDYEHVYEPAEDTFILLDAVEADFEDLREGKPRLCVEIGSGSGCVSAFLAKIVGANEAAYVCVDINKQANQITKRTGDANGVHLSAVTSNLLQGLEARLSGKIDVLLFNPPYVPTTAEEEEQAQQLERSVQGSQISAAWAGGSMGIRLLTMLLEGSGSCSTPIEILLAPGGRFYVVAIKQNDPDRLVLRLNERGLDAKIVLSRRAGRELLFVIRATKPNNTL